MRQSSLSNQNGSMLIEIIVSLVVLAIGLTGVMGLASDAVRTVLNIDRDVSAYSVASSQLEELSAPSFATIAALATATPTGAQTVGVNSTEFQVSWEYTFIGTATDPIRITVSVDYPGAPRPWYPVTMSTIKSVFL